MTVPDLTTDAVLVFRGKPAFREFTNIEESIDYSKAQWSTKESSHHSWNASCNG
jgi:hypothetical protein